MGLKHCQLQNNRALYLLSGYYNFPKVAVPNSSKNIFMTLVSSFIFFTVWTKIRGMTQILPWDWICSCYSSSRTWIFLLGHLSQLRGSPLTTWINSYLWCPIGWTKRSAASCPAKRCEDLNSSLGKKNSFFGKLSILPSPQLARFLFHFLYACIFIFFPYFQKKKNQKKAILKAISVFPWCFMTFACVLNYQ